MSAAIKGAIIEPSVDNTKVLVKVRFTPHTPNPAKQTDIEAVYEIKTLEVYMEGKEPLALVPLSCTSCDTRRPYIMTEPMADAVLQAAMTVVAENE